MSINKLLTKKNVGIGLVIMVLLVGLVMMGINGNDKANGLSEVYITENGVNVYKENKTDVITKLNKGDKVEMFSATPTYTSIKINNTVGFVETKFIDLSTANISEEEKIHLWSTMQESGLIKEVPSFDGIKVSKEEMKNSDVAIYNWHTKIMNKLLDKNKKLLPMIESEKPVIKEPVIEKPIIEEPIIEEPIIEEPVPPVVSPNKPIENGDSKYKDTVKYVQLPSSSENKKNPFEITSDSYTVIKDGVKSYDSPSTSAKVNATYSAGDKISSTTRNFDFVKNHYASSTKPLEWIMVQEVSDAGRTFSYVKRSDLVTNYIVYVSPSASNWKHDHNTGNTSSISTFKGTPTTPNFDSADYVTSVVTKHDPIYNMLAAGTSLTPTGTSNSSVKKPKAGTGASTSEYIPSTGTASGDGWVAPTLTKKYKVDRVEFSMDFESIGMYWNPTEHMGSIFLTGDGSRLDVIAVNGEETKARFTLTNVNTKESYRSKEMLKVVLPYFFKDNTNDEINKVHADFMTYISSGKTSDVTKSYKGFKAVFMKTESNKYRLDIR